MSTPQTPLPQDDVAAIDQLRDVYAQLTKELSKIIVGQSDVIEQLCICLFARGHALLMGVPGLAKTLLVSKLAETMKKRLAENPLEFYGVSTELLHEHMLYTALASEALAELSDMDPRNAYTGGLMRPLGILILDRLASRMPALEPYDHALHGSYINWEGRTFGVTNCDVAALVFAYYRDELND